MRRKEREETSLPVIEEIIGSTDVCHIALVDGSEPYIVAMNFGYMGGTPSVIYFHCAPAGRKLDIIKKNNRACFQFDTGHQLVTGEKGCDYTMNYKSVVGSGTITVVSSPRERESGLNCIMNHYTGHDNFSFRATTMERTLILKLEIEEIRCKVSG